MKKIELKIYVKKDHCDCEHGIVKSALKHTINILGFILIITFVINLIIHFIGENNIATFVRSNKMLAPIIAGIIGLVPNCASSVILTQLYVQNVIPVATMISGLLVGAGVGLAVLFKINKGIKENIKIAGILLTIGVVSGMILQLMELNFKKITSLKIVKLFFFFLFFIFYFLFFIF